MTHRIFFWLRSILSLVIRVDVNVFAVIFSLPTIFCVEFYENGSKIDQR
jgi:hypothetical protein